MTTSIRIPVNFDFTKYNDFQPYRERWLKVIECRFDCNHFLFDVSVISEGETMFYYESMSFSEMKLMLHTITS